MKTRLGVSFGFKNGRIVPRFSAGVTFDLLKFAMKAFAAVRALDDAPAKESTPPKKRDVNTGTE